MSGLWPDISDHPTHTYSRNIMIPLFHPFGMVGMFGLWPNIPDHPVVILYPIIDVIYHLLQRGPPGARQVAPRSVAALTLYASNTPWLLPNPTLHTSCLQSQQAHAVARFILFALQVFYCDATHSTRVT